MTAWLERRVIAFAHQGGSFEGPSSTLWAMARALAAGASALELDVHATRDRQLVVSHDATVDRTTSGAGAIGDLTLAELRELDHAYWWIEGADVTPGREPAAYPLRGRAPADRRLGVATLGEVLEAFPGVLLNLDIKATDPEVEPYEELLAETLVAHRAGARVIVASFHDRALERFRQRAPEVATSAGTDEATAFYRAHLAGEVGAWPFVALQVPPRVGGIEVVTPAFVDAAHRAGVAVHVWTLNERPAMEAALAAGVDGVISDRPTVLAALLAERAVAWDGLGR
ncbi:MAG TPA: glycerophosphodiester phosphodiesterase [Acidimicrobiales bacterium]|nr:glycerophosphodiester phosphodiesterase [Acidimicrobiales bacterium]